jgi:hypothetical protein
MKRKYPESFEHCTEEEVQHLAMTAYERIKRRRDKRTNKKKNEPFLKCVFAAEDDDRENRVAADAKSESQK